MRILCALCTMALSFGLLLWGDEPIAKNAKVFIAPMGGFETYFKAALSEKKVALTVVADKAQADYEITGAAESQKAGAAKTVKLPAVPPRSTDGRAVSDSIAALAPTIRADKPKTTGGDAAAETTPAKDADEEALQGLFGGDAPPTETNTGAIRRKASRLEELGFHHGIAFDPQPGDAAKMTPAAPPAAPRSSTAELTSILERIDKFLAEDTTPAKPAETKPADTTPALEPVKPAETVAAASVAAKAPETPKPPTAAAPAEAKPAADKPDPNRKTQPLWARSDAQDEDLDPTKDNGKDGKTGEGQQRLF